MAWLLRILSPDKHVDVCADGDEDRGSTPLASILAKALSRLEALACIRDYIDQLLKGRAHHSRARRCLILLLRRWRRRCCVESFFHSLSYSGRELVDGAVIVVAPVNSRAVKASEPIDHHPVIGKCAIGRTREGVNNALGPLTAANGT
jgi:hypothetical protein